MSPEKNTKNTKNENDDNLPFDIYDSLQYSATTKVRCEKNGGIRVDLKSAAHVSSDPNNASRIQSNEYDDDDEEDFISNYNTFIITIKCVARFTYKRNNCSNSSFSNL